MQAGLDRSSATDGSLAVSNSAELKTVFRAEYTMDLNSTTYSVTICFILAVIAWVVGWLFLLYMQMRRNKGQVVLTCSLSVCISAAVLRRPF